MSDAVKRVQDIIYRDTIQCLTDYDISEDIPRNDPEFGDAVASTTRTVIDALIEGVSMGALIDLGHDLRDVVEHTEEDYLREARASLRTALLGK